MEPATVHPMPTEPNVGDLVLHCGHVMTHRKHCFYAPDGVRYRRPDGSTHVANWVVCCPLCFEMCAGDPAKLKLKGDGIWEKK
jgi:hypothetical protein